ncbi:Pycsar system effector family protein [Streptomyces syringium]|uniref:Pycsar system effector family protein n=1 Tax=Streptomyces syringium TaxID=76729 RepID=UPI003AAED159
MSDIDPRLVEATGSLRAEARAEVRAEISRTDTKSGVLLTAVSLPLAALVATVPGRSLHGAPAVLAGLGAIGLVAAMLTVLVVICPHLSGTPRGSYLYWATCTPEEVLEDLADPDTRVKDLVRLSEIASRKYRGLQLAIYITAVSLAVLVAAPTVALMADLL